jgi:hypothetical protein
MEGRLGCPMADGAGALALLHAGLSGYENRESRGAIPALFKEEKTTKNYISQYS